MKKAERGKTKMPMYYSWYKLKNRGSLCDAWANDFYLFLKEIGDRPAGETRAKVFRYDKTKPYSPENFYWSTKPDTVQWQKRYRQNNSRRLRSTVLQRVFGITIDEYEALYEAQNGVCAICKEPETAVRKGVTMRLAVDHCHGKGHVRGLLCSKCNIALGGFRDSIEFMKNAIAYIERYSA